MTHLDLFSGIGGFSIAAEAAGFETVAFCEIDPEASLVLKHHWPHVPNLTDIHSVTRDRCPNLFPDLITGGVPCQPASALGQQRGTSDERWLWPEAIRVMRELRPRFGVFENPPALLSLERGGAWNGIVSGLVALGYDCWWDVFPAAAFGAGHLRERVILICADADSSGWKAGTGLCEGEPSGLGRGRSGDVYGEEASAPSPNANHEGLQGHARAGENRNESRRQHPGPHAGHVTPPDLRGRVNGAEWWHEAHTGIPVLATGLPSRLVEAVSRCVGNSVVPQAIFPVMEAIARTLTGATK